LEPPNDGLGASLIGLMRSNKTSSWVVATFSRLRRRPALWLPPWRLIAAQPSETVAEVLPQPMPMPGGDMTASDILIETLIGWDATHVFGM
jgi:hypothetical protein